MELDSEQYFQCTVQDKNIQDTCEKVYNSTPKSPALIMTDYKI